MTLALLSRPCMRLATSICFLSYVYVREVSMHFCAYLAGGCVVTIARILIADRATTSVPNSLLNHNYLHPSNLRPQTKLRNRFSYVLSLVVLSNKLGISGTHFLQVRKCATCPCTTS